AALKEAHSRLRPHAAVGVDGVSKAEYGQDLESRVKELHQQMVDKRYRHQPIKRVYIPKDDGTKRPIGISTVQDKVVQEAIREVLELAPNARIPDFWHVDGFHISRVRISFDD